MMLSIFSYVSWPFAYLLLRMNFPNLLLFTRLSTTEKINKSSLNTSLLTDNLSFHFLNVFQISFKFGCLMHQFFMIHSFFVS